MQTHDKFPSIIIDLEDLHPAFFDIENIFRLIPFLENCLVLFIPADQASLQEIMPGVLRSQYGDFLQTLSFASMPPLPPEQKFNRVQQVGSIGSGKQAAADIILPAIQSPARGCPDNRGLLLHNRAGLDKMKQRIISVLRFHVIAYNRSGKCANAILSPSLPVEAESTW